MRIPELNASPTGNDISQPNSKDKGIMGNTLNPITPAEKYRMYLLVNNPTVNNTRENRKQVQTISNNYL